MKRPKIEDFFPEGTSLTEALNEYKKSSILFNYLKALDDYADDLESERDKEQIRKSWPKFKLTFFDSIGDEECPNCFKKRPKGVICNFDVCHIRLAETDKKDDH